MNPLERGREGGLGRESSGRSPVSPAIFPGIHRFFAQPVDNSATPWIPVDDRPPSPLPHKGVESTRRHTTAPVQGAALPFIDFHGYPPGHAELIDIQAKDPHKGRTANSSRGPEPRTGSLEG